jgi:hypothetical protein
MNAVGTGSDTASRAQRWLHCASFVASLTIVLALSKVPTMSAQVAEGPKDERSCRDFVQQFYNWYISREALNEKSRLYRTTSDYVLQGRPQLLSRELFRLLKVDSAAQAKADEMSVWISIPSSTARTQVRDSRLRGSR